MTVVLLVFVYISARFQVSGGGTILKQVLRSLSQSTYLEEFRDARTLVHRHLLFTME